MHLGGQRELYLELFAQVGLREEHGEISADLLASYEALTPGVLTESGQTNAFTHADSPSRAGETQGSEKPIASRHCLHSGMPARHCAGSPYFLVAYEWQPACLVWIEQTWRSEFSILVNLGSTVLQKIRHRSCLQQSATPRSQNVVESIS